MWHESMKLISSHMLIICYIQGPKFVGHHTSTFRAWKRIYNGKR